MANATQSPSRPHDAARVTADSRAEYERRMHRVIEAIDQRLDQPLDLASLAAVAHFSPYHFHRLFAAWMGETLGDYLRRRRIEQAAARLASQPRLSVLQVALAVGFGSGEAFTRAFKARFGSSPSAWRAQRKNDQVDGKIDQAWRRHSGQTEDPSSLEAQAAMDVKLTERLPTRIAYMRHLGPYGEPISRFWMEEVAPWMATDGLMGRARYGISHDEPSVTDPAQCRYDACVEVDEALRALGPRVDHHLARRPLRGDAVQGQRCRDHSSPGAGCSASGCHRASCSSTCGRVSSITRWAPVTTPTQVCSSCDICIPVAPL